MFPWSHMDWSWGWGWSFAGAIGGIVVLAIFLVPWYFFLLNLQTVLQRVSEPNRAMQPGHVWLNFIPVFNLGWFIYTVIKVRDSVLAEYQSRGWAPEGDLGYNVGIAAGVLAIVTFFVGWLPLVGWGVTIAAVVCWIVYWLKTAELKNQLASTAPAAGYAPPPSYSQPPGPTGPSTGQPSAGAPFPPGTPPSGPGMPPAAAPPAAPPGPGAPPVQAPAAEPPSTGAPPATSLGQETPGQEPGPVQQEQAKICAACGSGSDPEDRYCRACGRPL